MINLTDIKISGTASVTWPEDAVPQEPQKPLEETGDKDGNSIQVTVPRRETGCD